MANKRRTNEFIHDACSVHHKPTVVTFTDEFLDFINEKFKIDYKKESVFNIRYIEYEDESFLRITFNTFFNTKPSNSIVFYEAVVKSNGFKSEEYKSFKKDIATLVYDDTSIYNKFVARHCENNSCVNPCVKNILTTRVKQKES